MVIHSYIIIIKTEIKYTKNLNNDFNQNVNMKKKGNVCKICYKYHSLTIYAYCSKINETQPKYDCRD